VTLARLVRGPSRAADRDVRRHLLVVVCAREPYGALRSVQGLCTVPGLPIVVARVAHTLGGEVIGVINAARIGASFPGPVIATSSLLAAGSPVLLYVALSLIGLACLPLSALRAHVPAVPR
jgi:hypothetical protein